jgi:hypothetical protein
VANQFYGDRTGGVEDPFGHTWHIATHVEDVFRRDEKARGGGRLLGTSGRGRAGLQPRQQGTLFSFDSGQECVHHVAVAGHVCRHSPTQPTRVNPFPNYRDVCISFQEAKDGLCSPCEERVVCNSAIRAYREDSTSLGTRGKTNARERSDRKSREG